MTRLKLAHLLFILFCSLPLPAWAQLFIPVGATVTIPSAINLSCADLVVEGRLLMNGATISGAQNVSIDTSGRVEAGDSDISLSGHWTNTGNFVAASSTVQISDGCVSSPSVVSGSTTFHNLRITSSTGKSFLLAEGATIYVSGVLEVLGTSDNPITLAAQTPGTARIILLPGGSISITNGSILDGIEISDAPAQVKPIPFTNNFTLLLIILLIATITLIKNSNNQRIAGKS